MKKKVIATVAATAFAIAAISAPAAAGYGRDIKVGCGASYGQLVAAARASGHVTGPVGGAANFINSGLAAAHGCDV